MTMLLVAPYDSIGFSKQRNLGLVRGIRAWADGCGLRFVIRPHPSERSVFWGREFPGVEIDTSDSFAGAVTRLNPRFVIGWWSTCLTEALSWGIVPVLVHSGSEAALYDMVYPLAARTVAWETGRAELEVIARDGPARAQKLAILGTNGATPQRSDEIASLDSKAG